MLGFLLLFFFFCLYWVFVAGCRLFIVAVLFAVEASLVAVHGLESAGASVAVASRLSCRRLWNLPGPGIEPVSPCIGRQILNHWTTREVLECYYCPWKLQGECSPLSRPPPSCFLRRQFGQQGEEPCLFNTLGNKGWLLPLSINKHYLLLFLC